MSTRLTWTVRVGRSSSAQSAIITHRLELTDTSSSDGATRRGRWADVDDVTRVDDFSARIVDGDTLVVDGGVAGVMRFAVDATRSGRFVVLES